MKKDCVIENSTIDNLYEAPLMLEKSNFSEIVCRELEIKNTHCELDEWINMVDKIKAANEEITIGLVGKYVQLHDAYISVVESLKHAGYGEGVNVNIEWIDSEEITSENVKEKLAPCKGIVVPGGFGSRGVEGMIETVKYARENDLPFLGICLGMQMAVVEFARNVAKLPDADSTEFNPDCQSPVIDIMDEQRDITQKGGTMRLGLYPCKLDKASKVHSIYNSELIYERHRHRWEFNNQYRKALVSAGLILSGLSPDEKLVEIVELEDHPWFVGVQFHPEFKSRPNKPQKLFADFIRASVEYNENK